MKLPFRIPPPLVSLRRVVGLACLLGGLCTQQAYAQPTLAANPQPDLTASNASTVGVQNTGADHVPLAGKTLRVMCWDGTQPGLGWSFGNGTLAASTGTVPLQGAALGKVFDPDIVADPGEFGARTARRPITDVLVTYLLNDEPTYEVWEYDASSNTIQPVVAPTRLLSSISVYGTDAGPNVDVDGNGRAVITWSQDFNIWAQTYDMPTRTASNQVALIAFDNSGTYGFGQPDVAVNHLGGNHGGTVSFVYVETTRLTGNQRLCMRQVPYLDIEYGVQFNDSGTDVLPNNPGGQYEFPRIAAPVNDPALSGSSSMEVVVADDSKRTILGLNLSQNSAFVSPTNLPTVTVLSDVEHVGDYSTGRRPVVSYCFDNIEVAWTLVDDQMPRLFNGSQEIIHLWLLNSGVPDNKLVLINQHVRGNQAIPSVAGRFSSFLAPNAVSSETERALYCFYDELQQEVFYKSLNSINATQRMAAPDATAQPIVAYPNPFQEETTFTLSLADGETVQSLDVTDPMGQPVRGLKLPLAEGEGKQQVRWDAAGLKPGLYQVRMRTNTGATYSYRVQHD